MRLPFLQKRKTDEPRPSPRGGEIALRDPVLYPKGLSFAPYNPDIFVMRKGGLAVYDKMRRDEQVKACQWIKRLSVLCSGWDIDPASDENADQEVADFIKDNFRQMKGTLEENIKNILTGMDYGYSVTEKVWAYVEEGKFRGKVGLKNLKTRKPHWFDFHTDEFGNLRPMGLWQLNGQYKYDPTKFVIYTHNKEFDNWYGTSDLQAAYRSWWSKDVIIKFWNIFLEKFGMGIPYLHPGEGKAQISEPTYGDLKTAVFALQGTSAIAQQAGDAIIEILESKRRGAGEYDKAVQYYDRAISRALLMPSGLGFADESAPGSLARSKTHFDVWVWIMMDLRKTTEEAIMNEQIVRELVDYNYTVEKYPAFRFNPLDDEEKADLAKLWLDAVKGKAVHVNADDENHFRQMIDFPERDREELNGEIEEEKNRPPVFPVGNVPDGDDNEKFSAYEWYRKLTAYEKRIDFRSVERAMDGLEKDTRKRLTTIFEKQRDKLTGTIEKAGEKIDQKWVNSLSLQYGVEVQGVLKEFVRTGYELGRRDAVVEIGKAKGKKHMAYIIKIPPKETITMLEKSAFWIKNVMFDSITKGVQALLFNMLDSGESPQETLMKIRNFYEPYIGDEQKVRDQKQIEPYRIETVIRTNVTRAYNRGKMVEFTDPELDGFVRAVQLSAILDTRTTEICRDADQKIIDLSDPLAKRMTPPLHHQCRTIVVPITEIDGPFEPSKQEDLHGVLEKAPPDFGGNVDK